jgi:hypothetical protein
MLDDTQSSMMIYPSNKTLSLGDRNVSGINIATNGQPFIPYTLNLGNSSSLVHMSGKVGIGNSTPRYPLHIQGQTPDLTASLYASNDIITGSSYIVSSDRRMKTNIREVQDDAALQLFRRLQPKTYEYLDKARKGTDTVYGFIAQEVQAVLPLASKTITDTIPNLYALSPVTGDHLTLDVSKLEYDATGQVFSRLRLIRDKEFFVNILSVEENGVRIDQTLTESEVFVYGQEVNNFHTLNKDAIWTVSAAALQEVDRQLQLEKEKTRLLQIQVAELKANKENPSLLGEIRELQKSYNHLLQRIQAIGVAPPSGAF